jgi:hypothetical protein
MTRPRAPSSTPYPAAKELITSTAERLAKKNR